MSGFVHLHVHSEYSMLDGACRISEIAKKVREMGQKAIALTDHGVMCGVIDFYEAMKQEGIKPIIGCEVYTAARRRFDKVAGLDNEIGHLVLLAKNNEGYKNLINIVSVGYIDGFYYKPRVDKDILKENSNGIIALSACLAGNIPRLLLKGRYDDAKELALEYNDIFGKDNFYLEIQDHGLNEQRAINPLLIKLSNETGIPLAATNDVHYLEKKDAKYQDVLMCIQTGKKVSDEDRMRFDTNEFYLKSGEEMESIFSYVPSAIENTVRIAGMCNVDFEFGKLHLPKYDTPDNTDAFEYITMLCQRGLEARYKNITPQIRERLSYELNMIKNMGFVDYFLIVWDYVNFAKQNDIMVGPGRGSAAGSIVAYTLYITDIDPLSYGLIFERFLNPERISMPDIDIDFCYERRQEVIDYVISKYGADRVSQIVTFGTMAARAVIRDVGRAMGIPYAEVDVVAKMVPAQLGITLEQALSVNPKLKNAYDEDARMKELIDTSIALEGLPRHSSTHAAGVVISGEAVKTHVPLMKNDNVVATQFPMGTLEKLGLLKMDFLGLRNLTVIRDTVELAAENGEKIDIDTVSYSNKEVYDMIGRGETDGVFQLESSGMKVFMKELLPTGFEDVIAGISLYRPGPMDQIPRYVKNKNFPGSVTYKHPLLENILNVTYGCIVYQEQVMQIVRDLAGYSLARADTVRKAMSKKKTDVMEKEREIFIHGLADGNGSVIIDGAVRRGVIEGIANQIYDEMIDFAKYAFNKSHAAAYAVLAYQTAYLKCFYKVYFMAALFNSIIGNSNKVAGYFAECARLNINILPPSVNHSKFKFTAEGDSIRFGIGAVRNVGRGFADAVCAERDKNGVFKGLGDFITRMTGNELNKRAAEELIKCGAFDFTGANRAQMLAVYENMIESSSRMIKNNIEGQLSLFGDAFDLSQDDYPDKEEFDHKTILEMEKEAVSIYLSGHPLDDYKDEIRRVSTVTIADILEASEDEMSNIKDGSFVTIAGIVTGRKNNTTRNGQLMAFLTFEDLSGFVEVIVFPKVLSNCDQFLNADMPLVLRGKLTVREDEACKIIAEEISILQNKKSGGLILEIDKEKECLIDDINPIISEHRGEDELYILTKADGQSHKCLQGISISEKLLENIGKIIGSQNIKVIR